MKKLNDINQARFEMFFFFKEQKISTVKKFLTSILSEKLKIVTYISNIWMPSVRPHPPILSPLNYGWKIMTEKRFELLWYDGEIFPKKFDIVIDQDDHDSENEDNEKGKFDSFMYL